jgi:hypothetical protein
MTFIETCQLLGVDMFILLLLVVALLDKLEHAVHSACHIGHKDR